MKLNYPYEEISPLANPVETTYRKGERLIQYKDVVIFADRSYIENGMVKAPVAGAMNYRSGLGYFLQNPVFDAIGSWTASAWNWITGAGNANSGQFINVTPGTQAVGEYEYNGQTYVQFSGPEGDYSMLKDDAISLYGIASPTQPVNPGTVTVPTPYLNAGQPVSTGQPVTQQPTVQPQSDFWGNFFGNIGYNTGTGELTVGRPATTTPGATPTTQPGAVDVFGNLAQQAAGAVLPILPWVIGAVAAAIVLPPMINAFSKRSA